LIQVSDTARWQLTSSDA